jgi:hypothetical protein
MKFFIRTVLLLYAGCIIACGNDKGYNQHEYILAQPRDTDLLGWWKRPYDSLHNDQTFWHFQQNATITVLSYVNGKPVNYAPYYWYTEKNDRNILHIFAESGMAGYLEDHSYYKIANDSVWMSEDLHSTRLYFFGEKTHAPPEGYK